MTKKISTTSLGLQCQFFPKGSVMPNAFGEIIDAFKNSYNKIDSSIHRLRSDGVLYEVEQCLINSQIFECEVLQPQTNGYYKKIKSIPIPCPMSGKNFYPDIKSISGHIIVEVEAGQGVDNYRFLKDLFESIVYTNCEYLGIAVRNVYSTYDKNGNVKSSQYDYQTVCDFINYLYNSRMANCMPLKGILVIGY